MALKVAKLVLAVAMVAAAMMAVDGVSKAAAQGAVERQYLLEVGGEDVQLVCDDVELRCYMVGKVQPQATATVYLPTVQVPTVEPTVVAPTAVPTAVVAGKVRINYATLTELDTLPGVGAVIGQRIIDARPLVDCADADARVKGWGVTMNNEVCPLVDWSR
jgi:DNA uptake protein ComE-like DNA-binding protein